MVHIDQHQWATRLRAVPDSFRTALHGVDDGALRQRPAPGEWSAIEVLGHMIDKMQEWTRRVERVAVEERPPLAGYDQDALVRERAYQRADPEVLLAQLADACDRFAAVVERLPDDALRRQGVHGEYGPVTIRRCVEAPLASVPDHMAQLTAAWAPTSSRET